MKTPPKNEPRAKVEAPAPNDADLASVARGNLKMGWWSLLAFLTFGIILESLHGFKAGYYLDHSNQTRRLMWTLAHAHGTLLALVNLAFAATAHLLRIEIKKARLASALLAGATILMPAGFFLGGVVFYAGDPGFGILLLPLGAVFLFIAVFLFAKAAR